jgi:transmembrane sensor
MKEDASHELSPGERQAYHVASLVAGFINGTLTDEENIELDDWVTASMANQRLFEELTDEKNRVRWMQEKDAFNTQAALERIEKKMSVGRRKKKAAVQSAWVYAAAASVLIAIMVGFLLIKTTKKSSQQPAMETVKQMDLPPGQDRAILTLADGKKLMLDSIQPGRLISQGSSSLKNDSGRLAYMVDPNALVSHVDSFNTLAVPAGGQYKLVLPDGTRVWLNAASSLRYPTAFTGAVRRVELTGEGYFEVAKDPMFPFEVIANGNTVRVLGTHFNINAYTNEPVLKITLEEGAVQVNQHTRLRPGEQALLQADGAVRTVAADIETELAWKNGQFIFKEAPLDMIMRQIGRWYDCDIIYNTASTAHFNASVSRHTPVSKLLHYLEGTGAVHFSIENKRIKVLP